MANSNVSSVAAMFKTNQFNTGFAPVDNTKQQSDFGDFLSQISGHQGDVMDLSQQYSQKETMNIEETNANEQDLYARESNQSQYKDVKISKTEQSDAGMDDTMREKLNAAADDIKDILKEQLGVTDEELQEAMQLLGINYLDLLNPENLVSLTAELTGNADPGALLMNEDFQVLFSEIGAMSKELMSDLGLTKEQLDGLLAQMKLEGTQPVIPDEMVPTGDLPAKPADEEALDGEINLSQPAEGEAVSKEPIAEQKTEEAVEEYAADTLSSKDNTASEADGEGNETQGAQIKNSQAIDQKGSKDSTENDNLQQQNNPQQQINYRTIQTTASDGITYTQTIQQTYIDVKDIMQQVSQFVSKIEVSQLQSSIEMQLNPENLGKLYLQVTSKDGVVTAQIAAQNEAVKDALEAQLAILKDNMNQQGIKVEAVEVTVATHEFDRNLEQNFYNRQHQQEGEGSQRQARRNINLNELEDFDGELTEEESLTARMMADNGNSVDMTA